MGKSKFGDKKIKNLKNNWQIIILGSLLVFILGGFLYYQNIQKEINSELKDLEDVNENDKFLVDDSTLASSEHAVKILLNNKELTEDENENVVFSNDLMPLFKIEYSGTLPSFSIDGSLNVLDDSFYGSTTVVDNKISFSPDFVLTPGRHKLEVTQEEKTSMYYFFLGYIEDFSKSLVESGAWIFPDGTSPDWFLLKNEELKIIPKEGNNHASFAFVYPLSGSFVINFEFSPIGENVSIVPYLINSVRNEMALGSNGNTRSVLFHTGNEGQSVFEGNEYKFKTGNRYQVRIERSNKVLSLSVRKLVEGGKIDPTLDKNSGEFKEVLNFLDEEKDTNNPELSYHFGVSVWQNSDGIVLDNLYILDL